MKPSIPSAPPLNYKSLKQAKDKIDAQTKNTKQSAQIMTNERIQQVKEMIFQTSEDGNNSMPQSPQNPLDPSYQDPMRFDSESSSEPNSVKKIYKIQSREKIQSDSLNQRLQTISEDPPSPKFNKDSELNQRDLSFESSKLNRILISNIETLEKELSKSNHRIKYLEEFNSQLLKSKNETLQEKEDLITRSIEYEYYKQRLEEREKRMYQLEAENSSYIKEIKQLRIDNDDLRQQMENMISVIKRYASTRTSFQEGDEGKQEFGEVIERMEKRIKREGNGIKMSPVEVKQIQKKAKAKEPISKKKVKAIKYKKNAKFIRIPNQHSPLSREQMKLLHDPTSFERYVNELDVSEIKLLDSSGKRIQKGQKSKSNSKTRGKTSRNKVSPFRTDGLFSTYGTTDGNATGREDTSEKLITRIKKKGPSYSQLQNKKKKKIKSNKRKQTFYEKVLSKTIGQPLLQTHDNSRDSMEIHYLIDPMNKTQNISNLSAQISDSKTNSEAKNKKNELSYKKYANYQPGGINISLDGRPVTSEHQLNRYSNMDADYPEILEENNYYRE